MDVGKVWELPRDFAVIVGWLSDMASSVTGRKGRLTAQTAKYACMARYYSCEKLKRRCGYVPIEGIEEGLERQVRWFKEIEEEDKRMESGEKKGQ